MSFTLDITRQNFVAPTLAVDLTGDDMLVWLNWALIALYIFFCYSYLRSFFVNSWEKETKQIMADNDIGIFDDFQFNHLAVIIPLVHCIWVMPNDVFVLPTLAFFVFTIWSFYAYTQISDTAYHLDKKKYQWRYMNKTQQSVRQNTTYSDFDSDEEVRARGRPLTEEEKEAFRQWKEGIGPDKKEKSKREKNAGDYIREEVRKAQAEQRKQERRQQENARKSGEKFRQEKENPRYNYDGYGRSQTPPPKQNNSYTPPPKQESKPPPPRPQKKTQGDLDFRGSRWANSRFKDQKAMNRYKSTYIAALTGENPTEKANSQIKLIQYDQGKDSRIAAWSED